MLKESIKSPIFTGGFRLIDLLCQSYPPHCVVLRLELSEWLWKKSHREQPIVRLAMCERSPLGLPRTQNRMSGCPQVAEILLMNSSQTPQLERVPKFLARGLTRSVGTVGKFSIQNISTQVAGGSGRRRGRSLVGKRSRDPGVCACAEGPVSGATCAAALRAHCAHTQLICESAVQMSSGANAHNTAWRDLLASKGLSGAASVLEGYGLSCENDLSLLVQEDLNTLSSQLKQFHSRILRIWVQGLAVEVEHHKRDKKRAAGDVNECSCSEKTQ